MAKNLSKAKKTKDDEFYTQYEDIQAEVNAYIEVNKDVFKGKTILLPCDDPEWSNFTKFFAQNFQEFGIKKLICTSYAPDSRIFYEEPTLWETQSPGWDLDKSRSCGRKFVLESDINQDHIIDFNDITWTFLDGDGDFKSDEVTALRNEADVIITNPPFSLFRDFLEWINPLEKEFLIVGSMTAITYSDVFPLIMDNKLWMGWTKAGSMIFRVPDSHEPKETGFWIDSENRKWRSLGNTCWFTNLEHGKRNQALDFLTMEQNKAFSKDKDFQEKGYIKYDNYDAIEVPRVELIPSDYEGVMGVPISYLEKHNPRQYEILGATQRGCHDKVPDTKKYDDYREMKPSGQPTGSSGSKTNENANVEGNDGKKNYFLHASGHVVQSKFQRLFIRKRSINGD
jgi:hypothetical protein